MTTDDVRHGFAHALRTLDDSDLATQLCRACNTALRVEGCGVSLHASGLGLEFASATDPTAERLEWAQITLGEGPALDSFTSDEPVAIHDPAEVLDRWPMLSRTASGLDLHRVCALPLRLGEIRLGVIDLRRGPRDPFGSNDVDDAMTFADLAGVALATLAGTTGGLTRTMAEWWNRPRPTREVRQATGMVVVQLGVAAPEAYARLRAHAFANGRSLERVAGDVVGRRLRFRDRDA